MVTAHDHRWSEFQALDFEGKKRYCYVPSRKGNIRPHLTEAGELYFHFQLPIIDDIIKNLLFKVVDDEGESLDPGEQD